MDNQLVLGGQIVQAAQTRQTPAGLAITRFMLEHRSRQQEAGMSREAYCRIQIMACGPAFAEQRAALKVGTAVRVNGFLSRANHRQGENRLVLHAAGIEILPESRKLDPD